MYTTYRSGSELCDARKADVGSQFAELIKFCFRFQERPVSKWRVAYFGRYRGHHGRDNLRRIRPQASRESRRTAKSVTLLAPPPQLPHPPARLYRATMPSPTPRAGSSTTKAVLTAAWSDYYAGAKCLVQGNDQAPHHVLEGTGGDAALFFMAIRR
jgi:hypothetical protein